MRKIYRSLYVILISLCVGQSSCSDSEHNACMTKENQDIGSLIQPVSNGTVVAEETIGSQVVLILSSKQESCTGVLVTNEWVLTAAHCTDLPSDFTVYLGSDLTPVFEGRLPPVDTQAKPVDQVLPHPNYDLTKSDSTDIALMHVSEPFLINNKSSGYQLDIYAGPKNSFLNQPLTLFGYGCTIWGGKLDGQLREAKLVVSDVSMLNHEIQFKNNTLRQSGCSGDSGGPLLLPGNHILGAIMFGVHLIEATTIAVPSTEFRDWVLSQVDPNYRPRPLPKSTTDLCRVDRNSF